MNICIGIISYLPDNNKRQYRIKKLLQLVDSCNKLFNLPIIIIAQNWKDINIPNCTIYRYERPLGIVGARKALRKKFLESNYDYLIMLDDDCKVTGTELAAKNYIEQIKNHPGMCGLFNDTLLKLFAISKDLFSKVDFGDGSVENGDFFEDILFVNTIKKLYRDKVFMFSKNGLSEISNNYNDPLSTWYVGQYNKHDIGDKTRQLLSNIC